MASNSGAQNLVVSSTATIPQKQLRTFFPPIQPYSTGRIQVSPIHELYYEQVGNPQGNPVVFLHGGPGGGLVDYYRQFFDPQAYRVVLFDQRGSGKSSPWASLEENTTWHLVEDIEILRNHLGISKWIVFGGSWGSTLALAYAETHPDRVKALILRGIFACREKELRWFYQEGASFVFPDYWEKYVAPIPLEERSNFIQAYHKRLTGDDEQEKLRCALAWTGWEMATSRLYVDPETIARGEDPKFAIAFARIENHYFINKGFLKSDNQLIDNAYILKGIPGVIVQGRYDMVCPMTTAWDLHKAWPTAELLVVPDAGHSAKEPGIIDGLIYATEKFKTL